MKKFTKLEIEGARSYFVSNGFTEVQAEVAGKKFSYFVLPQSLEPKLLHFVYRCTGNSGDEAVFGIADSVPEILRRYAIFHEVVEFNEIGIDTLGRCKRALERELDAVPADLREEHIDLRTGFFRNLVDYATGKPEYTSGDLGEFRASLAHLEGIV